MSELAIRQNHLPSPQPVEVGMFPFAAYDLMVREIIPSGDDGEVTISGTAVYDFGDSQTYTASYDVVEVPSGDVLVTQVALVDLADGEVTGFGCVEAIKTEALGTSLSTQPHVGYTKTLDSKRQQGLGTRRLFVMNDLAMCAFDQTLRSSAWGTTSEAAQRVWERLVDDGTAEFIADPTDPYWQFITK